MERSNEEIRQIESEIASLKHQQTEALKLATFRSMSKEEARAYDERADQLSRLVDHWSAANRRKA